MFVLKIRRMCWNFSGITSDCKKWKHDVSKVMSVFILNVYVNCKIQFLITIFTITLNKKYCYTNVMSWMIEIFREFTLKLTILPTVTAVSTRKEAGLPRCQIWLDEWLIIATNIQKCRWLPKRGRHLSFHKITNINLIQEFSLTKYT